MKKLLPVGTVVEYLIDSAIHGVALEFGSLLMMQIQFLPWHVSVETTERYLDCKQRLSHAVNDNLGLEGT